MTEFSQSWLKRECDPQRMDYLSTLVSEITPQGQVIRFCGTPTTRRFWFTVYRIRRANYRGWITRQLRTSP